MPATPKLAANRMAAAATFRFMFKFFAPSTPPPRVEAATEALHGERWCQEVAAGSFPMWGSCSSPPPSTGSLSWLDRQESPQDLLRGEGGQAHSAVVRFLGGVVLGHEPGVGPGVVKRDSPWSTRGA